MANIPAPFSPTVVPDTSTPPQAVMPAKPKKSSPITENKILGAKISIQFLGEDGKPYDATTTISSEDYKIQAHALSVEEKHEKKRDPETKDLIGFEDTGERILTFKLRYHVR